MVRKFNIDIDGVDIHYVDNYLGINLDNRLDFESHAKECLGLVSHKFQKVRNIVNKKQAITIYKSRILPILIMAIYFVTKHLLEQLINFKNYKI